MRVRNHTTKLWPIILICLAAGGCARTGAPNGWLPVPENAPRDPYGAWVTVEFEKGNDGDDLAGEFLAVDTDSLYVMRRYTGADNPVIVVSLDMVEKAKIASFDPETDKAAGWVALGSLSSLSHGLGAAVSFPLWAILGSTMAGSQSHTPLANYPDLPWDDLRMYARFPQGPPPGLHQLDLQPKFSNKTSSTPWSERETGN